MLEPNYGKHTSTGSLSECSSRDSISVFKEVPMIKIKINTENKNKKNTVTTNNDNNNDILLKDDDKNNDLSMSSFENLKELRNKNVNRLIIGHININSIRNKFEMLSSKVNGQIDILMISETKLDNSFPTMQFVMKGYNKPYRIDRNSNGGGILVYVREDIPSKILSNFTLSTESVIIEINLRRKKWLLCCTYNAHKNLISNHLSEISKALDIYSSSYDNIVIMGDFNSEPNESSMSEFCELYDLKNLIHSATCFKNPNKPSCIDLILTNRPKSFHNSSVIETGLSDFHKLTLTVMKVFYQKQEPTIIQYRDYKGFSNEEFRNEMSHELKNAKITDYDSFHEITTRIFDKHAPIKHKYVRANQGPYMNKILNKAIMNRSRLKNRFLANRNEENRKAFKKQRNYCVGLFRKEKKKFYNNLDIKNITDNRLFWKTVKPFFSEKSQHREKITLIEQTNIITNDKLIAESFNKFFSNIVKNLNIPPLEEYIGNTDDTEDPVLKAIRKYKNHPSINMIRNNIPENLSFSFHQVTANEIEKELKSLNSTKTAQENDVPTKIIKENIDLFTPFLTLDFNSSIINATFPNKLKLADILPIFKKDSRNLKENYRPVSILPNLSKVYERCIFNQMTPYFEEILSKFQCGFRKGHGAQHSLIAMIEKWRKCVDNGQAFGALLTDLSKAFDCLNYELLISKLDAYGFDLNSKKLIYNYLTERMHRVKINNQYSSWKELLLGVPQGSILGPILFNIYLCDLFFFLENIDVASYADDTTPYTCGSDFKEVIKYLEESSKILFKWFKDNYMKANADKCHLLLSTNDIFTAEIDKAVIQNSTNEKLLGVTIDSKLSFDTHVSNLCKKAGQKLNALSRLAPYMNYEHRRNVMKAFIHSQFGYCPIVWMNHSRSLNNRINRIHERALRIVYRDKISSFESLLERDDSVTIHNRNIHAVVTEFYKVKNQLSPKLMTDVFEIREVNYDLRNNTDFKTRNVKTVRYGTESITSLGPKLWALLPDKIKNSSNIEEFKKNVKHWKPDCPCRLCKTYIPNLGFL